MELVHASSGVDELLLAGEKRMASRANAELDVLLGRTRFVRCAAGANDHSLLIIGMNFWLHLEKGAEIIGIFFCGNTIPLLKKIGMPRGVNADALGGFLAHHAG